MRVYFYTNTMIFLALWTRLAAMIAYAMLVLCLLFQIFGLSHSAFTAMVLSASLFVAAVRFWAIRRVRAYHDVIEELYPHYEKNSTIASEFLAYGVGEFLNSPGKAFPGRRKMKIIRQIQKDLTRQ